jgi:DEAD/DEAH box helicase domain-containing protein
MSLATLLQSLRRDPVFMANLMAWQTLPARAGRYAPISPALHELLHAVLRQRGIEQLYLHQAQAVDLALQGQNFAVVTPTASGKTLCYTLPVLHTLLSDPTARALYLFPTKALAHDQLDELRDWREALATVGGASSPAAALHFATYDGDTASDHRPAIRREARLVLTNPDMLHSGILPSHTAWAEFLGGLRYVVIDELHTYRGVFGSHVANVLRRLGRLCAFYGSRPQVIVASATIANPQELAERLVEQPIQLITENGAPQAEKQILLYNPPLYDAERGLRRSSVLEAQALATQCVLNDVQTIVFARARLTTEILLTQLREAVQRAQSAERRTQNGTAGAEIRGYRGGYLPGERRAIEAGLRNGSVRAVVSTNALELGIDIGQLQAAILCGYPGTIASAWQQMGRAGRQIPQGEGTDESLALAILVATGGALDQYVIQHPEFLFERSPEQALINPDNLMILVDHMRCAAFELPFHAAEAFGNSPFTADVLALLAEQGDLRRHGERFFWTGDGYPARRISLRTTASESVIIQAQNEGTPDRPIIIGQLDRPSAPLLLHDGAIYLHEGQSYHVERLDLEQNLALVTPAAVDYYTEAVAETQIDLLATHDMRQTPAVLVAHGDLRAQTQVVGYRRVKRNTQETLGTQPLEYPPQVLETSGYWLSILPAAQQALAQSGQWYDSVNNYGPNWEAQRTRVRARDGYRCTQCGAPEAPNRQHDVHHLVPFRTFGYLPGLNENYLLANRLENLALLCRACHRRLESGVRVHTGLDGLAYTLVNLAPLHLMCDPQDLGVAVVRDAKVETENDAGKPGVLPTVYIYERAVAGLGFSARLYELHHLLMAAAHELIRQCSCQQGCPACVGPVPESAGVQLPTKQLTLALLDALCAPSPGDWRPDQPEEIAFQ